MNLKLLLFVIIIGFWRKYVDTTKIDRIARLLDDGCYLSPNLIEEIKSYKNITREIMKEITGTVIGKDMYKRYTQFIDEYSTRISGSDVLERAIDHMINLTYEYGVNDVTTEEVEVPHWVRGHESVTMLKPLNRKISVIGLGPNVPTPPEGITANVLAVKSFSAFDILDYEHVEGKIVLFNAEFKDYDDTVMYRLLGAQKAAKKGAVATLIRSITPYSLYTLHTGSQQYDDSVPKIPSGAITLEDADLIDRLQDKGETVTLNIRMNSTLDQQISRNTIIDLKGNQYPDNFVIVSGHIDNWDVGQGAMDGGGMMISWFVPVILNHLGFIPKRTVRAVLWTAKELGFVGAMDYFNKHRNEMDKINLLMESDKGTFKPVGLDVTASKAGRCMISEILKIFSPIDKLKKSEHVGSDISVFKDDGIPLASLLSKNDRYFWYDNSQADTLSVQEKKSVINCAAFWAAFSYVVADLSVNIPRE